MADHYSLVCTMDNRKGFTLVEVIIILAVLAVLAAVAIPTALRIFETAAEDATRGEMLNLKKATIGDSNKLRGSIRSDYGFLGDLGRLPANLDEILVRGTLPAYTFDTTKQAGAGWNGPYITGSFAGEETEDFKNDQLGNAYVYSDADFTNGNGELADGKITSGGSDGTIGTADDITVEILKGETTGTVRGALSPVLAGIDVDLNFPSNGSLATVTATTDSNGNFTFTSVPFGPRSVKARPENEGLILSPGMAITKGGGKDLEFRVLNFSTSPVVLTSLVAVYSDPKEFQQVKVGGVNVADATFFSGDTVNFSPTAPISASGIVQGPIRVFADAPEVLLPDIVLIGGTEAKIELKKFKNDITGVPFTITFSDGSVVSFTP